jgi:hypothetical protein
LQAIGISDRDGGQIVGRKLQHRDIGIRVAPDQLGFETAVVLGRDFNIVGVLDDVRICHDIALRGIDDYAGARRLRFALDRLLHVEEAAEHRVLEQRVIFAHPSTHRDTDDALSDPADHRRQTLYRSAAQLGYRRAAEDSVCGARHQINPA